MIFKEFRQNIVISKYLSTEAFNQLKKYLVSGVLAAIVEYCSFNLLLYLNIWHISSHVLSMLAGFFVSFLLNKYWSFRSKDNFLKQLLLTGILFIFNLFASSALMYILIDVLGIISQISKLAVMGVIVFWNFILFKQVIYKK